jgi:hypothetical protein
MGVPPDKLMQLMSGAGKGAGGAPPSQPGAPNNAPVGAPMTTPQNSEGEKQAAMIQISLAMDLLEKSLPPFGAESKEGQALMSAMGALVKSFGEKRDSAKPLIPAELKILMQQAGMKSPELQAMGGGGQPGAGAKPPGMPAGMPGGAPGGMPQAMAA